MKIKERIKSCVRTEACPCSCWNIDYQPRTSSLKRKSYISINFIDQKNFLI